MWSVVVPVKRLDHAKSRLRRAADPTRAEQALAFAADCIGALVRARAVASVIVVCSDPQVHEIAREHGASWIEEPEPAGLNAAAAHALGMVTGPAAVVVGDLPSLTPGAVDLVLDLAGPVPLGFISDTAGTGTTMLMAQDPAQCHPRFWPRSRARHRLAGFVDLGLDTPFERDQALHLARARRDVDTQVDLFDALRLGVGPATSRALHGI